MLHKSKFDATGSKDGHISVESNEYSRRPSICHNDVIIKEVMTLIMTNHYLTVQEIGDELGISKDSAHVILMQDLGMCRVSVKFVPRLLSEEQKQVCLDIVQDLLQTTNDNPKYLNTVITGNKSWVYGYDPEIKAQSLQWKHPSLPRPEKTQQVRSKTNVMLTVFFNC